MSDRVDIFFTQFKRVPHNKKLENGQVSTPDGKFGVFVFTGPRLCAYELEYNEGLLVWQKNTAVPPLERTDIEKILDATNTTAYKNWVFDPSPESKEELDFLDCYDLVS